jgi:hypothetical protein
MNATITEDLVLHAACPGCGAEEALPLEGADAGLALRGWRCGRCGAAMRGSAVRGEAANAESGLGSTGVRQLCGSRMLKPFLW